MVFSNPRRVTASDAGDSPNRGSRVTLPVCGRSHDDVMGGILPSDPDLQRNMDTFRICYFLYLDNAIRRQLDLWYRWLRVTCPIPWDARLWRLTLTLACAARGNCRPDHALLNRILYVSSCRFTFLLCTLVSGDREASRSRTKWVLHLLAWRIFRPLPHTTP